MSRLAKGYLVVWQLGNNEQSRDKTPIKIDIDLEFDLIDGIWEKIVQETVSKTGVDRETLNILSIHQIL